MPYRLVVSIKYTVFALRNRCFGNRRFGFVVERYFKQVLIGQRAYTRIGSWWDRKGENEIDLVAENELDNTATFFEVKRNIDKYIPSVLEAKVSVFMRATGQFKDYAITYRGISMADM